MAAIKVTLTLPDDLLAAVDTFTAAHAGVTRSAVCAAALRGWIRASQEAEIEAYYLGLSEDERVEDAAWRRVATQSAERLWE